MFVHSMIDAPNHALMNVTADTLIELLPKLRELKIPFSKEAIKKELKIRLDVQSFIACANLIGRAANGRYFEYYSVAQVPVFTIV
jgi:hypothetical protein